MSLKSAEGVLAALSEAGYAAEKLALDAGLPAALVAGAIDVVFPVAHGPLGEDGCLQGLLEVLGVPYVGSGVRGSAIAAHKPSAKRCFRANSLPVAEERVVTRAESLVEVSGQLLEQLGDSVIVKPASGGSAIGVSRLTAAATEAQIATALELALQGDEAALVEQFLAGQEVTCGVLETESGARALPPTLVHSTASSWYDFRARYQAGGSRHECPAPLAPQVFGRVQQLAVSAHVAVGARDLSRVDFVVSDERMIVLEVNTLPGMTPTSNYPEAAEAAGIPFADLCHRLVQRALDRPRRGMPTVEPIP